MPASLFPAADAPQLSDLLRSCLDGQAGQENRHLWSSPNWMAHEAGRELSAVSAAESCRMSRGFSVRIETAASVFVVKFSGAKLEQRKAVRV